ncbi:MAG: polyisoprenoid-binding protein [Gemmatimonadales bacterium]|nr:MAG: polyisoprenoid-binding protein [Gemmatimonadales bacterium]
MNTFKKLAILGTTVLATAAATADDPASWNVDGSHTEVTFSVRHFFTPVSGTFDDFEMDLTFDQDNPANSRVSVQIQTASVNTRDQRRDDHLRSEDFFEASAHPTITFTSSSVRQDGPDRLIATGPLTIKGVTREVELPITILGVRGIPEEMREMLGGITEVAGFQAGLKLDRRDFGVGVGNWAATAVVGAEVDIVIAVEANRS